MKFSARIGVLSLAAAVLCCAATAVAARPGGWHGGYRHGGHVHGGVWIGGWWGPGWYGPGYWYSPPVVYGPPQTIIVPQVVEPAVPPAPDPIIYPRNGQSPQQTEADRQDCNRWATTQPQAMADTQAFNRAVQACMDGRGYSMR